MTWPWRLTVVGLSLVFKITKDNLAGELADDSGVDVDQYDVGDADITTGKAKNIFKLITTRYFKSAYPVLVEEAK